MLKIKFYNSHQKYVKETTPFPNREVNIQINKAFELMKKHTGLSGWTIYEQVGTFWLPYHPFNRCIRYDESHNIYSTVS